MYSTKSFCNIFAFASNEPGVVSPLGELTTFAKTFTKELGVYHHPTLEGYDLLNFSSRADGVLTAMQPPIANEAIFFVDEAVKTSLVTIGPVDYAELLLKLKTKAEEINAYNVEMGPMVSTPPSSPDGQKWLPEWISWSSETVEDNNNKVWLSLSAFQAQYTDYEIVVIPPFDDLDSFFNPSNIVENRIKAITPTQMMERVELAKDGYPETLVRTDPYEYRDPMNSEKRFDTYWTVLIYGLAGNDPDIIRDELVEYILAHSTHTREEWAIIFPDIFKRTEFIFAPFWDTYAAEQRVFDHGIYSPIVNHNRAQTWLEQYAEGYTPEHITAKAQILAFPYRSMQMAVIGHVENRDMKHQITDYYGDFINTGTVGTDFGRMSVPTQEWAVLMMELVTLAENVDESTDMPRGIFKVKRGELIYIGKTFNRVLFLVLAKINTLEE